MKVTKNTKRALAFRREERLLTSQGFKRKETDPELIRGGLAMEGGYAIVEAKISVCGRYVYTKVARVNT
jgi:hypothetical protein